MKFNQYIWNLYKQAPIGEKMIKYFSDVEGYDLFKRYCPYGHENEVSKGLRG